MTLSRGTFSNFPFMVASSSAAKTKIPKSESRRFFSSPAEVEVDRAKAPAVHTVHSAASSRRAWIASAKFRDFPDDPMNILGFTGFDYISQAARKALLRRASHVSGSACISKPGYLTKGPFGITTLRHRNVATENTPQKRVNIRPC
jgi:hypothetical protein